MNKFVSVGLGAAAVIVALVIGIRVLGPSAPGGVGSAPSASLSPTAAPSASPQPSRTATSATSLSQTFTSAMHGISLSYPEGWTADPASDPWTDGPNSHSFDDPRSDHLHLDPIAIDVFLTTASQRIADATTQDWIAAQMAEWADIKGCAATEPITVDGATGRIGGAGCDLAVVTTDGRGYWISLRVSDHDTNPLARVYDRAWFEDVLATVKLHPNDAVDAKPSSSP